MNKQVLQVVVSALTGLAIALTMANPVIKKLKKERDTYKEYIFHAVHELKNPLAAVKVLADALNESSGVPIEIYKEFMRDICMEIDRETSVIDDLLELAHLERKEGNEWRKHGGTEHVDISELSKQIMEIYMPLAAEQKVSLIFEGEEGIKRAISAGKFSLIAKNLIENSIRYNRSGGTVRVKVWERNGRMILRVRDNGIGMKEEYQRKIFEKFYRINKEQSRGLGGTGLGLSIAAQAAKDINAVIKVKSREGKGSCFLVVFG